MRVRFAAAMTIRVSSTDSFVPVLVPIHLMATIELTFDLFIIGRKCVLVTSMIRSEDIRW